MTDMTSTTRATLLERLHDGGDALAWDDFFARYWPAVYGYARHRGCSEHTAEEIVQDVMLLIFEQRDIYQYDPTRGRFRDWLGTVVRNKIAEHRRRPANRIHGQGGDSNGDRLQQIPDAHEPDDAWESTFENNLLLAILDIVRREINARTYLAFELLAIQEMSGSDAARITGLSRNAVYKAAKRVIGRLIELGAPYRDNGRLTERIQRAFSERPPAAVERSLTERIQKTMCSR
jgi:RNA polymerase sigma-70 factor (ECF subfamily)